MRLGGITQQLRLDGALSPSALDTQSGATMNSPPTRGLPSEFSFLPYLGDHTRRVEQPRHNVLRQWILWLISAVASTTIDHDIRDAVVEIHYLHGDEIVFFRQRNQVVVVG